MASTSTASLQQRPVYDTDVQRVLDAISQSPNATQLFTIAHQSQEIPQLPPALLNRLGQNLFIVTVTTDPVLPGTQRRLFADSSKWQPINPTLESSGPEGQTQIYLVPLDLAQRHIQYKFGQLNNHWGPAVLDHGPNQTADLNGSLTFADHGKIPAELRDPSVVELAAKHPESSALLRTAHLILENPEIERPLASVLGKTVVVFAQIQGREPSSQQYRLVGAFISDQGSKEDFWKFDKGVPSLLIPSLADTKIFIVRVPAAFNDARLEFKLIRQNPETKADQWNLEDNTRVSLAEQHIFSVIQTRTSFAPSAAHSTPRKQTTRPQTPSSLVVTPEILRQQRRTKETTRIPAFDPAASLPAGMTFADLQNNTITPSSPYYRDPGMPPSAEPPVPPSSSFSYHAGPSVDPSPFMAQHSPFSQLDPAMSLPPNFDLTQFSQAPNQPWGQQYPSWGQNQ